MQIENGKQSIEFYKIIINKLEQLNVIKINNYSRRFHIDSINLYGISEYRCNHPTNQLHVIDLVVIGCKPLHFIRSKRL